MNNYYININRQFGSLGRPIAKELAKILNIEYYDRDIVEEAAKKLNISVSEASDQDEKGTSPFARMAHPLGQGSSANQDKLFSVEQEVILGFANKGSGIFVGRCADYVLREKKNCLNVFIYAPEEERYLNCVNTLGMEPKEARDMIAKVDKARELYWKKYTGHTPDDFESNHLMINSSLFGVTGTAKLLASIAKSLFQD